MCPKKRRWVDKDMTHVRLAFRVFQKFYKLTTNSTKEKTEEDFINSSYYTGFVKFGRACVFNEWLNPEQYAEWLINHSKRLQDWCKDSMYDEFLLSYIKKETGLRALERSIMYLASWSAETGNEWQDYFKVISPSRAVYDIRSCKISPWVIYLSETGDQLLTRMNAEQIKMIDHVIDANFWMDVFKKDPSEVDEVQATCQAAGI